MLKSLRLENFTVFPSAQFDFSPGINAFVGENGTGKTHLLKVAYCLDRAWSDLTGKPFTVSKKRTEVYFEERLLTLFQVSHLSRLVRRGQGRLELEGQVYGIIPTIDINSQGNSDSRPSSVLKHHGQPLDWKIFLEHQDFNFGYREWNLMALLTDAILDAANSDACVLKSVFVPSKEIVSLYDGLAGLLERYEIKLDATYRDLLPTINSPELNRLPDWFEDVFREIEGELGIMKLDETRLVFVDKGKVKTEAPMMAEGFRKLALLMYLVRHGAIEEGGTLFWDEPEANLNLRLIAKLAKILVALASHGIQVNFATHSLFFLKEIDLQLKIASAKNKVSARFFALADDGSGVQVSAGDSLEEIEPIVALDMEIDQAERYNEWLYRTAEKIG